MAAALTPSGRAASGGVVAVGIVAGAVVATVADSLLFWELIGPVEDALTGFAVDALGALVGGLVAGAIVAGSWQPLLAGSAAGTLGAGFAFLGRYAARSLSVDDPPVNLALELSLLLVAGIGLGALGGMLGRTAVERIRRAR